METFVIIASIVIFAAVGVLLPIAIVGQSKRTREKIERTDAEESTDDEACDEEEPKNEEA